MYLKKCLENSDIPQRIFGMKCIVSCKWSTLHLFFKMQCVHPEQYFEKRIFLTEKMIRNRIKLCFYHVKTITHVTNTNY